MTLQVIWVKTSTHNLSDLQGVQVPRFSVSSYAEEGSVAISDIEIDDPLGSLTEFVGHRLFVAYESAEQPQRQIILWGYVAHRKIKRGEEYHRSGAARKWIVSVADTNSLLSRRLITGADGDRPEETDIARIQWLLDSDDQYLSNPRDTWLNPSPYIDTSTSTTMSAVDLRGQTAFDVLNDCAQRSGNNWFAFYDESTDTTPTSASGSIALFYAKPESAIYTSSVRLTTTADDVDDVTTFNILRGEHEAELTINPARTYSGIWVPYGNGQALYQQSLVVQAGFQQRDIVSSHPYINTLAEAQTIATRMLADGQTEDERFSASYITPATSVNALKEGQRFQFKAAHWPGYSSSYNYARCLRRTVTQLNDELYRVDVEATPTTVAATCTVVQSAYLDNNFNTPYEVTLDSAPTEGNTLLAVFWQMDNQTWTPTSISGGTWTLRGSGVGYDATQYGGPGDHARLVVYSRVAGASESATTSITPDVAFTGCMIIETQGLVTGVVDATQTLTAGQTLTLSSSTSGTGLMIGIWAMQRTRYAPSDSITAAAGVTELRDKWRSDEPAYASPHCWAAYTTRTGAGAISVAGAPVANPELNKWGVFAVGIVLEC